MYHYALRLMEQADGASGLEKCNIKHPRKNPKHCLSNPGQPADEVT